jgi:hypothetical protein
LEDALERLGLSRKAIGMGAVHAQLEGWVRGDTAWVLHNEPQPSDMAGVPHGAACEGLLRTCSNRRCANLEGDSEAGLQLARCARCGAAWYCGAACQRAHWRAGHKEACRGGRGRRRDSGHDEATEERIAWCVGTQWWRTV